MKFLKGLALGLLSFLLFLSLSIFGLAFMLNNTILNPNFVVTELDKLDVPSLAGEVIDEQISKGEFSEKLGTALVNTITKLEPLVKEQVGTATHTIYDYLLGKSQSPELALTLRNTFLSTEFVASLLDELDLSLLAEELIREQIPEEELPAELRTSLVNTINKLEPRLKETVSATADPIFDYLLGQSQSLDLALTLRNILLNSDFVVSLVNELDISSLVKEFLSEQLTEEIPEEMEYLAEELDEYLDDVITELEPWIKEQLGAAADPILAYLLGESRSLNIVIPLEPVKESLEDTLREAFLESLPPEYADLPQSELDQLFDEYFAELTEMIPETFELDENLLGTEIPTRIAEALAEGEVGLKQARQGIAEAIVEAEKELEQGRQYVGYFQLGYKLLIGFILLLILGIILINREVRGATRKLGIIFLTYGAFEYAGILVAKYFAWPQLAQLPIPSALQAWLPQLAGDFLTPLEMFSLGLLIGGIALLVVSFVYKPRQPSV